MRVPPGAGAALSICAAMACATSPAISLCTAKISASPRSNVFDQRLKPVAPSLRLAVIRTVSPDRRTVPSRMKATWSLRAKSAGLAPAAPAASDEAPAMTLSESLRDKAERNSSVSPCEKNACSGSGLRLRKGRMAMLLAASARSNSPAFQPTNPPPPTIRTAAPAPMPIAERRETGAMTGRSGTGLWLARSTAERMALISGASRLPCQRVRSID